MLVFPALSTEMSSLTRCFAERMSRPLAWLLFPPLCFLLAGAELCAGPGTRRKNLTARAAWRPLVPLPASSSSLSSVSGTMAFRASRRKMSRALAWSSAKDVGLSVSDERGPCVSMRVREEKKVDDIVDCRSTGKARQYDGSRDRLGRWVRLDAFAGASGIPAESR